MHWLTLAIFSASFYGLYHFAIKASSGHIHQVLGAVLLQGVALLCGLMLFSLLAIRGASFDVSVKGVQLAILAGLGAGIGEILSYSMFAKGVSASVGIPVLVGGTVVTGFLLGIIFAGESFDLSRFLGVVLVVMGIVLLSR